MTTTVRGKTTRIRIRANFGQASSPILYWAGRESGWITTPFQVADASHSSRKALGLVVRWCRANGGL